MEPSNPPQDDPPPRPIDNTQNNHATMPPSHCELSDSLNRLTLANAAATPLPTSPSLLSPKDVSSRPFPPNQPAPRRIPSTSSLRDERRKSIPALQKRQSTASLRSVSASNGPSSPLADSSRRSSVNIAGSPTTAASPAMLPQRLAFGPTEPQGPTAASIAAEHFQKEVDLHQVVDLQSKTVVVVHDACYGHRFSRPRASKALLSSIVERPERIRACVLGISAAYVRLGRRHAGELFAPHPDLDLHLLPPPPFQIRRTSRSLALSDVAVTNVHGTQWMADLKSMCDVAESRLALTGKELVRPRTQGNDGLAFGGPPLHSGDLYLCAESLNAFEGALGGVCDGIDAVLGPGPTTRAFVCIRPPGHHCSADFPSGFCWINNVHVGISYAAMNHGLTHAAILDFDLHHGDGSQDITWDHNLKASTAPRNAAPYKKTAIGYYSLHDINSYPCEGGDPDKVRNASVCIDGAHGQSIWNVHLDTWEAESEFWKLYRAKYTVLINKARAFLRNQTKRLAETPNGPPPKAAIFISAGFDASEWESTGMQRHKVNVPTEFYAKFTADVVRMSQEEGLGVDGRVISVLEGGYSDRALTSGVLSHLSGLGNVTASDSDIPRRPSVTATSPKDALKQPSTQPEYDINWWSPNMLAELDALVSPPSKGQKAAPTYFAPTRSFSAKVVAPTRDRKYFSSYPGLDPNRPPLPEVGWATAVHELSKVLIPKHRQTMSCRPEDLNAEASRQRRERQVALDGGINPAVIPPPPPPPPIEEKRQLRVRKTKSPTPYSPRPATPRQQAMRKNRRTTIDGNDLPDVSRESSPSLDASRRKSATAAAPVAMGDLNDQETPVDARAPTPSVRSVSATGSRKTSGSRPGTPKRSASPRKQPPVPKVPTAFLPSKLADEVTQPSSEVENLSVGIQRLKLKMPSPEVQAAREKKTSEERKQTSKGTRAPKSPKSPRKTSGSKSARSRSAVRSETTPTSSLPPLPTPSLENLPNVVVMKQENPASKFGMSSDAPFASSPLASAAESIDSSATDGIVPASKPSEWTAPLVSTSAVQQTTTFATQASPPLTPDNITPNPDASHPHSNIFSPPMSAAQTKNGLPVFTSSSPIPFATPEHLDQGHRGNHPPNTSAPGQGQQNQSDPQNDRSFYAPL
ncbi:uncharacterized protein N7459_006041 [Penicillium hispanicum]|uniref:uncharacterized protein n=1 Tax=Penicillium hispanicum TaxID=1080232 RepID=UPI002540CB33|nr:uncharacterized protein N7459_006041 [Penicillium hispanicum]KAJ5580056.1 hypothetical protein N7459_006041 [Penicillium hispanicum]